MDQTFKENERSARGVTGYLIRHLDGYLRFRVYDPEDRSSYKDYRIAHHDLQVQITDDYSSFYDEESDVDDGYIDYPSRLAQKAKEDVLRKKSEAGETCGEKQADSSADAVAPIAAATTESTPKT